MSKKKQLTRKDLIKVFVGYGYHIWVILILANVLLVYTIQFYLRAAPKDQIATQQEATLPTEAPTPTEGPTATATPTPVGPVLNVSFQLPGIGSQGGNLKPQHPKRNLYLLFYSTEVNSNDSRVKPLHTLTSNVTFDPDPKSSTYGIFTNKNLDLGTAIPPGRYQLVFKLDQVLSRLIKEKENAVGGQILTIDTIRPEPLEIPIQNMIAGDIFNPPHGDNIMNGKDHEMLLNCFGTKASTPSCPDKTIADINDDGAVDGTDYNIMLGSFRRLKEMGLPVPSLVMSPSVPFNSQISKKPTAKPVKKTSPTPQPSSGGGAGGAVLVLFILLIGGGVGGFFAYKKGLFKKLANPSPKTPPDTPAGGQEADPNAAPAEGETPPEPTNDTTAAEGTAEASTQPDSQEVVDQPAPDTTLAAQQSTEQPAAETPAQDTTTPPANLPVVDGVDKEYYVKKKSDDKSGAVWLTLTDDNGPVDGLYKGTTQITEGFFKVKGTKKIEGEKTYIEISDISPVE